MDQAQGNRKRRGGLRAWLAASAVSVAACGGGASPAPPPPCDQSCQDATAVLGLRDAMKLVYNLTLQGKPVGAQDGMTPCPMGGSAHVFGQATSNASQGTTNVQLTYVFTQCAYMQHTGQPAQSFNTTLDGTIAEMGTLAVQPQTTTALEIMSDSVTITGTVYDPPIAYTATTCALVLAQDGNDLSGMLCGRTVGLTL